MIATGLVWDVWGRVCRFVSENVERAANRLEDRLNPWFRRRMYRPGNAVLFDNLTELNAVDDRRPP